jgi:hypothetical protein
MIVDTGGELPEMPQIPRYDVAFPTQELGLCEFATSVIVGFGPTGADRCPRGHAEPPRTGVVVYGGPAGPCPRSSGRGCLGAWGGRQYQGALH